MRRTWHCKTYRCETTTNLSLCVSKWCEISKRVEAASRRTWHCKIYRVGQNRTYTPSYDHTVCMVISLPQIPCIHRIYLYMHGSGQPLKYDWCKTNDKKKCKHMQKILRNLSKEMQIQSAFFPCNLSNVRLQGRQRQCRKTTGTSK